MTGQIGSWLVDAATDVRYCVRSLRNNAGFAATVILTLALGVGANAAMFSFLEAVFVKPPAGVVAPSGVRRVWARREYSDGVHYSTVMSYAQYEAVRDALTGRSAVTVYRRPGRMRLTDGNGVSEVSASYAPSSFFSVLGARPRLRRFFAADEDALGNPAPVAIVSESYWRREL